ncbi:large ribosomal RNA subunit accumulation protein YCED homolog 2, chloroplastic [Andrographis paniculata]|uniref:large ribosomal RNA subunit accumulation protein YCED homolog 2, chloroplastic n=1 Tax=Andrographis paniculata TaxID=175694 RepID=UPI0021E78C98|nr:large ribosomal RNA subunit accumulation protein YCED homolog 2, chloroplastic [Andrographis paniculata]
MSLRVRSLDRRGMAGGAMHWIPSSSSGGNISTNRCPRNPLIRSAAVNCKRNEHPMVWKKKSKPRLIKISPSDGRWHDNWTCDYTFSLQELQLHDLPDDAHKDTDVCITLCIHKHAGLGLSVDGKITTCFTRKCCNCCTPFLREINTTFRVWILPSTRQARSDSSHHLPEIGGDDPSVIYVRPGYEADLDSLIQDTVRLATSVREYCSESCEKSKPKLLYVGAKNIASIDRRWSKLLELKKTRHDFTSV